MNTTVRDVIENEPEYFHNLDRRTIAHLEFIDYTAIIMATSADFLFSCFVFYNPGADDIEEE